MTVGKAGYGTYFVSYITARYSQQSLTKPATDLWLILFLYVGWLLAPLLTTTNLSRFFFVWFLIPETKGMSLERMDDIFVS